MPDWKITLTRAVMVNGIQKAVQTDVAIEDTDRNLGIIQGIDRLLQQASEIVPEEACAYWRECRSSGSKQLYEIQSDLETQWGITFGSQEINGAEPPPAQPHRNGKAELTDEPADLDSMLKNQLRVLQARNAVLNTNIDKMTAERDKNDANIMRIAQFLAPPPDFSRLATAPSAHVEAAHLAAKKRGRKPKEQPHAE